MTAAKQTRQQNADAGESKKNTVLDPESGITTSGLMNQGKAEIDVLSGLSLVLMAIFFICGAYFLQRDTRTNLKYPFAFFLAGSTFYLVHGCLDLYKSIHYKVKRIIPMITFTAGGFWFTASIFLFRNLFFLSGFTNSFVIWSSLWLVGSGLNIISITCSFAMMMVIMLNKSTVRPIFLVASIVLSWIANMLFLIGCAIFIKIYNQGGSLVEYDSFSKLFVAASIILLFHSVCYTWHYLSLVEEQ